MKEEPEKILLIFLMRFRRNIKASTLSGIFEMNEKTIQNYYHMTLDILHEHFTPKHLGFHLFSQQDLLNLHTPTAARDVLPKVTLSGDGTYFRVNKSLDHELQFATYNHKGYNLVKTMDFTALDGHVVDVFGPFKSDGSNDDGQMMNAVVQSEPDFVKWMDGNKVRTL